MLTMYFPYYYCVIRCRVFIDFNIRMLSQEGSKLPVCRGVAQALSLLVLLAGNMSWTAHTLSPLYLARFVTLDLTCMCIISRIDDGDWSTERCCVCTWNLDRRGLDPKRPDLIIDAASAVMCLSFHPQRPSLIAGKDPVNGLNGG